MPSRVTAVIACLAAAFLASPATAQGRNPPPKAVAEPAPPPPIFPCRTREEVCFLAVVVGPKVAVLFTNAPQPQALEPTLRDVTWPDGSKVDVSASDGRIVMLAGDFDPKAGITKAEVVEVASPLASLAIKAQLSAGAEEPKAAAKAGGRRR